MLFLLLLVAAELYVRSDAFSARIRPYVDRSLAGLFGPTASVGTVRANLIPLYLELRDVTIPDAAGQPLAAAGKIRGYLNPLPLLAGRISIPRIVLLEPTVTVVRNGSGTLNISALRDRLKGAGTQPSEGMRVVLRKISITQGTVLFTDAPSGRSYSLSQLALTANVKLAASSASIKVTSGILTASSGGLAGLPLDLRAALHYGLAGLAISSLEVSAEDATLSVTGTTGNVPGTPVSLSIRGRAGARSLSRYFLPTLPPGRARGLSAVLSGKIGGTITDPDVEGSMELRGIPAGTMTVASVPFSFAYRNRTLDLAAQSIVLVRGSRRLTIDGVDLSLSRYEGTIEIRRCEVRAGDLTARLTGSLSTEAGLDGVVAVESTGEGHTLGFFTVVPLGGRIGVKGVVSGDLASPRFDGVLSAWPLTVRGISFDEIGGKVRFENRTLTLSSAQIRRDSSRYTLAGDIVFTDGGPLYTGTLVVERSDVASIVSLLYKPLPLSMSASGELSFHGTARDFTAAGQLNVEKGTAYGESFEKGAVSVSVTPQQIAFTRVVAYKGHGVVTASGRIGFDKSFEARLESRQVDLRDVTLLAGLPYAGPFRLDITASGTFRSPKVSAAAEVPKLTSQDNDLGALNVRADSEKGVLKVTADLDGRTAFLAGRLGLHAPFDWSMEARVEAERIDPFLFTKKKDLIGRASLGMAGEIALRGRGMRTTSVNGSGTLRSLSATLGDYRLDADGEPGVEIVNGTMRLRSIAFSGPGTKFSISGTAALLDTVDLAVAGTASLSLLRVLFDEVEHGSGEVSSSLALHGDWSRPFVSGRLNVTNGEVKVKGIPQKFAELNGGVEFDQDRIVTESFTGVFGGGTVGASGWVSLAGFALQDFSLRTHFNGVTVRFPEGLTSTLSGELSYDGDAKEQALTGDVTIQRARYEKRVDWKSMLVDVGRGFSPKRAAEVRWMGDTALNIRFHGKDNILLRNNLATIPLDIDIFIRGTAGQPQLLGRVEARKGTVYFRRNDFTILRATVDFFDPGRINPALDIQAETKVREYHLRLSVSGTADRAQVTFISDPPLADNDILTLLALGKTGTELKGIEGAVGMGEAASFATGKFQDIFEQRARSITGLDRFQVDPYVGKGDTSVPRITVGKELVKNKLYFTYSQNVTAESEQAFRFEYLVGKRLYLVGEGNQQGNYGADVKFRFEFK
jgi:translocation and assembly module TamB